MSRRILCKTCGAGWKAHPQDVLDGWQYRVVNLVVKKPEKHQVSLIVERTLKSVSELPSIECDSCGEAIPDGSVARAVTMWRAGEILEWEGGFGVIIPPEAAKMGQVLTKEPK